MVRLAVPVVTVQVGMMLMGVVDTVMVGHLAPEASPGGSTLGLAAVALGHLYFFGIGVFGMGTLLVLDPVVAQAVGAGDSASVARGIQRGVLLAVLLALPLRASCGSPVRSLRLARQPADVVALAARYTVRLAPGVLPFFLFIVFRQSLQALRRTGAIVAAIVLANVANGVAQLVADLRTGPGPRPGSARLRLGHDGQPLDPPGLAGHPGPARYPAACQATLSGGLGPRPPSAGCSAWACRSAASTCSSSAPLPPWR